jgi:hypothetical protein
MPENGRYDGLIGFGLFLLLISIPMWYFEGFGIVLGGLKWIVATILASILSSIISTVILLVFALVIWTAGKTYLSKRNS